MGILSNGKGAFNEEELKEFLKSYKQFGRHKFHTEIDLGDNKEVEGIVNSISESFGNALERLSSTIFKMSEGRLGKKKLTEHSGDCSIYSGLVNGTPESGICTCGYGLQVMRDSGNPNKLYSNELKGRMV